jgi:hypothetical protein
MSGNDDAETGALRPQVVDQAEGDGGEAGSGASVIAPSKLIRIASMTRAMLDEVRRAPLDDAGRLHLLAVYRASLAELYEALGEDLRSEVAAIFQPLEEDTVSESELRIVQAQLVGWLEGLFHGIQASLWSQQMAATAQLEEMRRRALEAGEDGGAQPGLYL